MSQEWKEKVCKWLVKKILGDSIGFTIIRKEWLHHVAMEANRYPNSKLLTLKILRLDGTDFRTALHTYEEWNKSHE